MAVSPELPKGGIKSNNKALPRKQFISNIQSLGALRLAGSFDLAVTQVRPGLFDLAVTQGRPGLNLATSTTMIRTWKACHCYLVRYVVSDETFGLKKYKCG